MIVLIHYKMKNSINISNSMEEIYVFSKHFCFDFGKMPDNYEDMVNEEILSISAMGNMFKRSLL